MLWNQTETLFKTKTRYIHNPKHKKYVVALISDTFLKLPYADFIIEDSVAGTTPMTT